MTFHICCSTAPKPQRRGGGKKIALASTTSTQFNYQPGSGVSTSSVSQSVRAALLRRAGPSSCTGCVKPQGQPFDKFNRATLSTIWTHMLRTR